MRRKNLFSKRNQHLNSQELLFQLFFFLFLHFVFFITYNISQGQIHAFHSDCYQILNKQGAFNLKIKIHNKRKLKNLFDQQKFKEYADPIYLESLIKKHRIHFTEEVNLVFNQYIGLINEILDENKRPKDRYKNKEGLMLFVKQNLGDDVRDMDRENTIKAVRAFLDEEVFNQLNWPKPKLLKGPVKNKRLKLAISLLLLITEEILNEQGEPKDEYQSLNGLALVAEKFFQNNMHRAFDTLSSSFTKNTFIKLRWIGFLNSVDQFEKLKHFISSELFDQQSKPNPKYIGMEGQLKVTEQFFDGNLSTTYNDVAALVKKSFFKKLGWQRFMGSVDEYEKIKKFVQNMLFNSDGTPHSKYVGTKGLILFIEEINLFDINLKNIFTNVSAVLISLEKYKFKDLKWKQFLGDLSKLKELQLIFQSAFFDKKGNLSPKYKGMDGLALFAENYYGGKMRKAWLNVSFLLGDKDIFHQLGWRPYFSTVSEYKWLKELIQTVLFDQNGNLNPKYKGMDGLALFAEEYLEGNMKKAFFYVLTINMGLAQELSWRAFYGYTSDYKILNPFVFSDLLKENGSPNSYYINMDGFLHFIQWMQEHLNQPTRFVPYIYHNMVSLLGKEVFLKFKWNKFNSSIFQLQEMTEIIQKSSLFSEDGKPNPEYKGRNGFVRFAEKYFKMSDVDLSFFRKIIGILGKEHLEDFGWRWIHFSAKDSIPLD